MTPDRSAATGNKQSAELVGGEKYRGNEWKRREVVIVLQTRKVLKPSGGRHGAGGRGKGRGCSTACRLQPRPPPQSCHVHMSLMLRLVKNKRRDSFVGVA